MSLQDKIEAFSQKKVVLIDQKYSPKTSSFLAGFLETGCAPSNSYCNNFMEGFHLQYTDSKLRERQEHYMNRFLSEIIETKDESLKIPYYVGRVLGVSLVPFDYVDTLKRKIADKE